MCSLCAPGTETQWNLMGLVKVGKKCVRGRNVLILIFVVLPLFNQNLLLCNPVSHLGTVGILGWTVLCCRVKGGGGPMHCRMFGGILGLYPLDATHTPSLNGNPKCVQTWPDVPI